jgi:hypothetical protein
MAVRNHVTMVSFDVYILPPSEHNYLVSVFKMIVWGALPRFTVLITPLISSNSSYWFVDSHLHHRSNSSWNVLILSNNMRNRHSTKFIKQLSSNSFSSDFNQVLVLWVINGSWGNQSQMLVGPVTYVSNGLIIVSVFLVVLLCVFTFCVPCCNVRYDFCMKTMFGSSLPPVVGWLMPYLRYLCLFVHSGVQHILCYVFILFSFVLCTLCCQFL